MATSEERQKILEMVAGGKISAQEAASLLNAGLRGPEEEEETGSSAPEAPAAPQAPVAEHPLEKGADLPAPADDEQRRVKETSGSTPTSPSWLRVRINDLDSGRSKVSVNIPLGLMKAGLQLGHSFAPGLGDVDWHHFSETLTKDGGGLLVEVQDEDDGEHVRIFIE